MTGRPARRTNLSQPIFGAVTFERGRGGGGLVVETGEPTREPARQHSGVGADNASRSVGTRDLALERLQVLSGPDELQPGVV
jgi:hypothetical protein